jgi:hypothetical protein
VLGQPDLAYLEKKGDQKSTNGVFLNYYWPLVLTVLSMLHTGFCSYHDSAAVGFSLRPYKETIGSPVFASLSSRTAAPLLAVPLKPCSVPKTLIIFTPKLIKLSALLFLPMMQLWFATMPTRFPLSFVKYFLV